MATQRKTIKCRVCGKPFEPCDYCQDNQEVFRWRNFACSLKCAEKYINETIEYRKSGSNNKVEVDELVKPARQIRHTSKNKLNKKYEKKENLLIDDESNKDIENCIK